VNASIPEAGETGGSKVRSPTPGRAERYVVNVAWTVSGVVVNLANGFLLTRYLIHKLGDAGYGLWTLLFVLVEYYYLFDLGFRSATVKFVAHYRALNDNRKLSEVISTSLVYALGVGVGLCLLTLGAASWASHFLQIPPAYRDEFPQLLRLVGVVWCAGLAFNLFGMCLEAAQCFAISTRAWIVSAMVRTAGTAALLWLGYGLREIVYMSLASQVLCFVLYYAGFRRVFPGISLSPALASRGMLRELSGFGIPAFLASISQMFLTQSAPVAIGMFRPSAFVGYYNIPVRLLQFTIELVGRSGIVTNANVAELSAKGESQLVAKLAVYANRYCLVLYFPLSIVMWTHGREFLTRWVGADFANQSAPVLPILLAGNLIAVVGQFNSSMLLMGLARHRGYARGMMLEAVAAVAGLAVVVPRYGIVGAAAVVAVLMALNRSLLLPWLVCREIHYGFLDFMNAVYTRPVLTAVPVLALCWFLKWMGLAGETWWQLIGVGVIASVTYLSLAYVTSVPVQHRRLLKQRAGELLARRWNAG